MKFNLRLLYLYLFSFVGLIIVVIGGVRIVDLGMKTFIFKDADIYESYPITKVPGEPEVNKAELDAQQRINTQRQRQRDLSSSLAMIIIGAPLYFYHWNTIKKERIK